MLVSELLTTVRDQLQDTREATQRHTDAKLLRYLNRGLAEARRMRPDLFLPGIFSTEYALVSSDTFPLDFGYAMCFVEYVGGYVSLEEDEYVSEGRAAALLTRFQQKLIGVGM